MKFCFKFLIFFLCGFFIETNASLTKEHLGRYLIEVGGINIGNLELIVVLDESYYNINIDLKNKGLVSRLYSFEGAYSVSGTIDNNNLIPSKYSQYWKTNKKERLVKVFFDKNFINKMVLVPKEDEFARVDIVEIKNFVDPLSSFIKILLGHKISKTIDGRRIYSMVVDYDGENKKKIKIFIDDYVNIWTDHKRKSLKFIEITKGHGGNDFVLPKKIKIRLNKASFVLTKI
tara:strand:- start:2550 stop:3242 length:693 start_codon:yes stop_codon:yes gene_type:complete